VALSCSASRAILLRQGADVALPARRVREACNAGRLQHVGASATLAGAGKLQKQRREVARIA